MAPQGGVERMDGKRVRQWSDADKGDVRSGNRMWVGWEETKDKQRGQTGREQQIDFSLKGRSEVLDKQGNCPLH